MIRRLILPFLFFLLSLTISAQDVHFTQFYASPLTLNPAMTGNYSGRFRVGMIYRDQWRGVLEAPYKTFSASADVRFNTSLFGKYKDAFAIGLLFFTDEVSGIDFVTNELALSGALHKSLAFDQRQVLSAGFQLALAQRSINYERLTFDDEFNSIDGFTLGTSENLPPNNFAFSDFNVGLNYHYKINKKSTLNVGAAMHHIFQPQMSFYPETDTGIQSDSKLYTRYSGQISYQMPIANYWSLIPRILFTTQGPHTEVTAGSNLRIPLDSYSGNAVQAGIWARPVRNYDDSVDLDAIIAMVGLEWNSILIGLSYDINVGDLTTYRQGQRTFELSIQYLGDFEDESILCPKF